MNAETILASIGFCFLSAFLVICFMSLVSGRNEFKNQGLLTLLELGTFGSILMIGGGLIG